MGLRKDLSATGDVMEVGCLISAFEHINSCTLSVCFRLAEEGKSSSLVLVMTAHTKSRADAAPAQLASLSFNLSQLGYKHLKDAITYALYQIDSQVAAATSLVRQPK